mmetsp:Transcript_5138/g.10869  ORF Transcript_5138/g.10869 Transcript_5138/m.10869 type:complete len:408 (-) Transcript_5138:1410-2633(-)
MEPLVSSMTRGWIAPSLMIIGLCSATTDRCQIAHAACPCDSLQGLESMTTKGSRPPALTTSTRLSAKRTNSESTAAARSGGVCKSARWPLPSRSTSGEMAPALAMVARAMGIRSSSITRHSVAFSWAEVLRPISTPTRGLTMMARLFGLRARRSSASCAHSCVSASSDPKSSASGMAARTRAICVSVFSKASRLMARAENCFAAGLPFESSAMSGSIAPLAIADRLSTRSLSIAMAKEEFSQIAGLESWSSSISAGIAPALATACWLPALSTASVASDMHAASCASCPAPLSSMFTSSSMALVEATRSCSSRLPRQMLAREVAAAGRSEIPSASSVRSSHLTSRSIASERRPCRSALSAARWARPNAALRFALVESASPSESLRASMSGAMPCWSMISWWLSRSTER